MEGSGRKEVEGKERGGCRLSGSLCEMGCISHLKAIKLKQTNKQTNSPAGSLIKEIQLSITLRTKSYTVQQWVTIQTGSAKLQTVRIYWPT